MPGIDQPGSSADSRILDSQRLRVLDVGSDATQFAAHQAAGRRVIASDAVDSDFWDQLLLTKLVRLVLLAMPGHAGNIHALTQLQHRAFNGFIAAIMHNSEEVNVLRSLGADGVFHVDDEVGTAFAEDAVAGAMMARCVGNFLQQIPMSNGGLTPGAIGTLSLAGPSAADVRKLEMSWDALTELENFVLP